MRRKARYLRHEGARAADQDRDEYEGSVPLAPHNSIRRNRSGLQRTVQPFQYDYPISGTGTGDPEGVGDGLNASYSSLTICVVGGRIVDTNRHHSLYQGDGCLVQERSEFVLAKRNHPRPLPPEFRTEAAWLLAGKPR